MGVIDDICLEAARALENFRIPNRVMLGRDTYDRLCIEFAINGQKIVPIYKVGTNAGILKVVISNSLDEGIIVYEDIIIDILHKLEVL